MKEEITKGICKDCITKKKCKQADNQSVACSNYEKDVKWKCKGGKLIRIRDMETSHIENAINYLKRKSISRRADLLNDLSHAECVLQGEQSLIEIEKCQNELEETSNEEFVEEYFPIIVELEKELAKREAKAVFGLAKSVAKVTEQRKGIPPNLLK